MDPSHSESEVIVLGQGEAVEAKEAERALGACRYYSGSPAEVIDFHELGVPQKLDGYTDENRTVWRSVFRSRIRDIHEHGCTALRAGVRTLELSPDAIPEIAKLNAVVKVVSGWQVIGIPTTLSPTLFAQFLSQRICPIVVGIRSPDFPIDGASTDQPSFCLSPVDTDLCSEVFAIPPLLLEPDYARFLQRWGELMAGIMRTETHDSQAALRDFTRLFDLTICRGIIAENGERYFYGAEFVIGDLLMPLDRYQQGTLRSRIVPRPPGPKDRDSVAVIKKFSDLLPILERVKDFHPWLSEPLE